jgi:hypothetical protein
MLQAIRPLVHVGFLSALLFSGAAQRVQEWLMRPSVDGAPARLWTVVPVFVAMLFGAIGLLELITVKPRELGRWLDQLAQRAAMFFIGAAWVVSWQQLVPTAWGWLCPVLAAVVVVTVCYSRCDSWKRALIATIWICVGIVLCARFIPWWTRGTPLYVMWQALAMTAWSWIGQMILRDDGALIGPASSWWGNVTSAIRTTGFQPVQSVSDTG